MTLSPTLSQAAVDLVVSVLVRLILPAFTGDSGAAKALALDMLAEYQPQTLRELRLAGEVVGLSLDSLNALGESAQPGAPVERVAAARRWACGLSRAGYQAQRRLEALQRARQRDTAVQPTGAASPRNAPRTANAEFTRPEQGQPDQGQPDQGQADQGQADQGQAEQGQAEQGQPEQRQPQEAQSPAPQPEAPQPRTDSQAKPPLAEAEATYVVALAQLNLMKARYKGAPPPHSQAAQRIHAQQRIVDAARMKLKRCRKQPHAALNPQAIRAAA